MSILKYLVLLAITFILIACSDGVIRVSGEKEKGDQASASVEDRGGGGYEEPLNIDEETGIPIAITFQFPEQGFSRSDFGFGFGKMNENYNGNRHLGADTIVGKTPFGTEVVAPANGIVRITTDTPFGGYGSDNANDGGAYKGYAIVLEHMLPSGNIITSVLGHIQSELDEQYDPASKRGNPSVGSIVRKGQYVAHVAHFWHGSHDWHHTHFGVRRGAFNPFGLNKQYVAGYDAPENFKTDTDGKCVHEYWLDPLDFVEAHDDPPPATNAEARQHPSGTLLVDADAQYWIVVSDGTIAPISATTLLDDRYILDHAIHMKSDERACYWRTNEIRSLGDAVLYKRSGTSTVVVAYEKTQRRYDFLRWEVLLSWGFSKEDIHEDSRTSSQYESGYASGGFRTLRPGTLVKGDSSSEVCIVTWQNTRLPIFSGDLFEALRFDWNDIVSIPDEVLDLVAGPREDRNFGRAEFIACPAMPSCGNGGVCGGGYDPPSEDDDSSESEAVQESVGGSSSVAEVSEGGDSSSFGGSSGSDDGVQEGSTSSSGTEPSIGGTSSSGGATGVGGGNIQTGGANIEGSASFGGYPGIGGSPAVMSYGGDQIVAAYGGSSSYGGSVSVQVFGGSPSYGGDPVQPLGGTVSYGGAIPSSGGSVLAGSGGSPDLPSGSIVFRYDGPVFGALSLEGWWDGQSWGTVCLDDDPSDRSLECALPVPSGSREFEFNVLLPDGRWWGDLSCSPNGGCGATIGTITLTRDGFAIAYEMKPNNPDGNPYDNGYLAPVP